MTVLVLVRVWVELAWSSVITWSLFTTEILALDAEVCSVLFLRMLPAVSPMAMLRRERERRDISLLVLGVMDRLLVLVERLGLEVANVVSGEVVGVVSWEVDDWCALVLGLELGLELELGEGLEFRFFLLGEREREREREVFWVLEALWLDKLFMAIC